MPSVEKLTLEPDCRLDHFHAALETGMVTVTELTAFIDYNDIDRATAKLESLTRMIRGAVRLISLMLTTDLPSLPRQLVEAVDACATVTHIEAVRSIFPARATVTDIEAEIFFCYAINGTYSGSRHVTLSSLVLLPAPVPTRPTSCCFYYSNMTGVRRDYTRRLVACRKCSRWNISYQEKGEERRRKKRVIMHARLILCTYIL